MLHTLQYRIDLYIETCMLVLLECCSNEWKVYNWKVGVISFVFWISFGPHCHTGSIIRLVIHSGHLNVLLQRQIPDCYQCPW